MRIDRAAAPANRRTRQSRRRSPRQLLLSGALVCITVLALAACGSSSSSPSSATNAASGLYGSLPAVGTPTHGGTITASQLTGQTPTYIFPIIPGANVSTYDIGFVSNMFLPLYDGPKGATPEIDYSLSLANPPTFSNGNKTVTITMKPGFKWANGAPVDANDFIFFIDLLKAAIAESPANWAQYVPGEFPDNLASVKTQGQYTVILTFTKSYNPGFTLNNQLQDTNNVYALPSTAWNIAAPGGPHLDYTNPANAKKIYDYLSKAGGQVGTFGTNPLWKDVDGPFALKSFNSTNSSFVWLPNPSYGGSPKPYASQIDFNTYTGITPQLNALKTNSLDIGGLDFSQLGQVGALRAQGYHVFGEPSFGWFGAEINYKDTTDHFNSVISQLYVRQAIAHLENEPAYVTGIYKGAAVQGYGPVAAYPKSPYTPADAQTAPYPYNPAAAVALLKAHGWKVVPNGQTTCAKAGTGAGECGAGIPAGTPIKFTWFYPPASESPSSPLESEALASEAKQAAGINIILGSKTFNFLLSNYTDTSPATLKNANAWGVNNSGGIGLDYYPTSDGIFNAGGGLNDGDYTDPTAAALIHNSVYGNDPNAVSKEISYLTKDVPVFFMPSGDIIGVVSKRIGGDPRGFLSLTQEQVYPQFWYIKK